MKKTLFVFKTVLSLLICLTFTAGATDANYVKKLDCTVL